MPDFLADLLSRPDSGGIILAIKAAKDWGKTPMQLLIPEHTRQTIEDLDYEAIANADVNLMMAWQVLSDESCPKCGTPSWIGHNNDRMIQFEIRETLCYACEAVDEHEEKERKTHDGKLGAGSIYYPVPFMADKSPLPTREIGLSRVRAMEEEEYGEPGEHQ